MPHSQLTFADAIEALDSLLPVLQQVPDASLLPLRTTPLRAWEQTLLLYAQLLPLLPSLEAHFSDTRSAEIRRSHGRIQRLALAFQASDCNREEYEHLRQSQAIRELEFELRQTEGIFNRALQVLMAQAHNPQLQPVLSQLTRKNSRLTVSEGITLAQTLEAHWPLLEHAQVLPTLQRMGLHRQLLAHYVDCATRWLKARPTLSEVAESRRICHQAYTLFCQTFDDLTRVGRYLKPEQIWTSLLNDRAPIFMTSQGVSA